MLMEIASNSLKFSSTSAATANLMRSSIRNTAFLKSNVLPQQEIKMSVKLDTTISQTTATPEYNDAPKIDNVQPLTKLYKDYFKEGQELPGETTTLAPNKVSSFHGYVDENTIYIPHVETEKVTTFMQSKL